VPPSSGLLYNTREWHSLQYNCRTTRDPDVMTCDMVQVSVRKQAHASDLKEKIDKGPSAIFNREAGDIAAERLQQPPHGNCRI